MADCATSIQQFKALYDRLNSLTSRYRTIRNTINIVSQTDTAKITSGINQLTSIISEINNLKDRNREIYRAANWDTDQCPDGNSLSSGLDNDIPERIDEVNNIINTAQNRVDQLNAENAKKQAAATQQATTSQSNAGTGVPGTAGTGPGASPAPAPSPTTVAGPTGPTGTTATGTTSPKPVTDDPAYQEAPSGAEDFGEVAPGLGEPTGTTSEKKDTVEEASRQDAINYAQQGDWRVRLALAPRAKYLYDLPDGQNQGILSPLRATDGVIFPYTPAIVVNYVATYDQTTLTHSNYKAIQYQSSAVDSISITADFTAQDTFEANYLLAVIHFFRTVTKMFYGQDQNPKAGTPPPLCYLYGLGQFQFNKHPLVITNFTYTLPTDVDYIKADIVVDSGVNISAANVPTNTPPDASAQRQSSNITSIGYGGTAKPPRWSTVPTGNSEPTYVPTKIQIALTALPIVSRNDISNRFSVKDYATGKLLRGSTENGGGIW